MRSEECDGPEKLINISYSLSHSLRSHWSAEHPGLELELVSARKYPPELSLIITDGQYSDWL